VPVEWDPTWTRAAFRLFHPKGNSLTLEMMDALRASIAGHPHLKRVTLDHLVQTAGAAEGIAAFVECARPGRWIADRRLCGSVVRRRVSWCPSVKGRGEWWLT
jgi:hypothetical protein